MHRYYRARLKHWRPLRSPRRAIYEIAISIVTTPAEIGPFPSTKGNRHVCHVWQGLEDDKGTAGHYFAFAQRIARAWSAILLATELVELTLDCPPEILADAVEERGEMQLMEVIRRAYQPHLYDWPSGFPVVRLPELPAGAPGHGAIVV